MTARRDPRGIRSAAVEHARRRLEAVEGERPMRPGFERVVLLAVLAFTSGVEGVCTASQGRVAEVAAVSLRTVQRAQRNLERAGALVRVAQPSREARFGGATIAWRVVHEGAAVTSAEWRMVDEARRGRWVAGHRREVERRERAAAAPRESARERAARVAAEEQREAAELEARAVVEAAFRRSCEVLGRGYSVTLSEVELEASELEELAAMEAAIHATEGRTKGIPYGIPLRTGAPVALPRSSPDAETDAEPDAELSGGDVEPIGGATRRAIVATVVAGGYVGARVAAHFRDGREVGASVEEVADVSPSKVVRRQFCHASTGGDSAQHDAHTGPGEARGNGARSVAREDERPGVAAFGVEVERDSASGAGGHRHDSLFVSFAVPHAHGSGGLVHVGHVEGDKLAASQAAPVEQREGGGLAHVAGREQRPELSRCHVAAPRCATAAHGRKVRCAGIFLRARQSLSPAFAEHPAKCRESGAHRRRGVACEELGAQSRGGRVGEAVPWDAGGVGTGREDSRGAVEGVALRDARAGREPSEIEGHGEARSFASVKSNRGAV